MVYGDSSHSASDNGHSNPLHFRRQIRDGHVCAGQGAGCQWNRLSRGKPGEPAVRMTQSPFDFDGPGSGFERERFAVRLRRRKIVTIVDDCWAPEHEHPADLSRVLAREPLWCGSGRVIVRALSELVAGM